MKKNTPKSKTAQLAASFEDTLIQFMMENNINQNNKVDGYISMLEEKTTDPKTRSLFECLLQQNSEKDDIVTRLQKKLRIGR